MNFRTLTAEAISPLEEGMVFSIRPGVYIQGRGGVRIEDTVVLTREGAHSLTTLKKDLDGDCIIFL